MALGAYGIWGFLPLYLRLVRWVPPYEFIAWRVLFTLPVCLFFLVLFRQFPALGAALRNRKLLRLLALSAFLVAINWTIYVAAVQSGHVLAASLGYYINPLANVLAGTLFLGERLTRRQWLAVALAAIGVSLLAWDAREMLWISLSLAITFCAYGLVRKLAPVESLPGLTIETMLLLVPSLAVIGWFAQQPTGGALAQGVAAMAMLSVSGVLTGVPLLLFAAAARIMDYSSIGMTQFVAPTIVFILGVSVFGEALRPSQLACFMLIWCAIAVFVYDIFARRRSIQQAPA